MHGADRDMENIALDFKFLLPQKQGEGKLLLKSLEHSDSQSTFLAKMICQKRFPRLSSRCGRVADPRLRGSLHSERSKGSEEPTRLSTVASRVEVPSASQICPTGYTGGVRVWGGMRRETQWTLRRRDAPFVPYRLSAHYARYLGQAVCQISERFVISKSSPELS